MLRILGRNLRRRGCRPIIGAFLDSRYPHLELAERAQAEGLETNVIACRGRLDWHSVRHIRRVLGENRVDVLHAHGYKTNFYGYAAARRTRTAMVSTCHGWTGQDLWTMRKYAALDRFLLRFFDRVVAVSDMMADTLKSSGVHSNKVRTISNGIELERFRNATPTLRGKFRGAGQVIGMVGRMDSGKGGDVLLRAMPSVLAEFPDTTVLFVGDGPCRKHWESLAHEFGVAGNVVFAGVRQDMPEVYASLDVLVLPSFSENLPMCVLEAMAAARPVVATPVGSVDKLVLEGRTGLMVNQGDAPRLAQAIVFLLRNPEIAREMGETARLHVAKNFSADLMTHQYLKLYEEAVRAHASQS